MLRKISSAAPKLRFNKGWNKTGTVTREKDTRTPEELLDTIEFLSSKSGKEVKQFFPEIKKMNPKYLGLVSDTLEFANSRSVILRVTNLNAKLPNGKTVLTMLLPKFLKAAETDHKALDFAMDVINNTDRSASERFLTELALSSDLENPAKSVIFDAARPMIKDVAHSTLKPPYIANNSLENFVSFIKLLTSDKAKPEKVRLFKDFSDFIDRTFKSNKRMVVPDFIFSDVPDEKILDNMKTLSKLAPEIEKQNANVDVVDFVLKNTNLK